VNGEASNGETLVSPLFKYYEQCNVLFFQHIRVSVDAVYLPKRPQKHAFALFLI